MNALTGKMCDGNASIKWAFRFEATSSTVSCYHSDGAEPPVEVTKTIQTLKTVWHESHIIEIDDVPNVFVQIEFLPNTAQALIPYEANQGTDVKILLKGFSNEPEQKTICFNRIAGIPELSDGDIDCIPTPAP